MPDGGLHAPRPVEIWTLGVRSSCPELRRLERGTVALPTASDAIMLFTPTQSAVVLGGLDPAKDCGRRRYNTPASIALPGAWGGADSSMRRSDDSIDLRQKLTHADAIISELRNLVVKLRALSHKAGVCFGSAGQLALKRGPLPVSNGGANRHT